MYFFWKCFCYHEETGQWLWMWNSMLRIWWSDVGKNHWLHLKKIDGVISCFANSCQHRLEFLVHFETGRWTVSAACAPIPDLCPCLLNCSRALNFTTIFSFIEIRQNITNFKSQFLTGMNFLLLSVIWSIFAFLNHFWLPLLAKR